MGKWQNQNRHIRSRRDTIFALHATWLNVGGADKAEEYVEASDTDVPKLTEQLIQLAQCWVLGDSLQDSSFCNEMINLMLKKMMFAHEDYNIHKVILADDGLLEYVWSSTIQDSPLRRMILDNHLAALHWDIGEANDHTDVRAFYFDLAKLAMKYIHEVGRNEDPPTNPWRKDPGICENHVHEDGELTCQISYHDFRRESL